VALKTETRNLERSLAKTYKEIKYYLPAFKLLNKNGVEDY
jgi:hypothetical protein